MGVAVGGLHFKHTVADLQHGDVECAAAQVVDRDVLVGLLVEAVGQRGGGRLVNDAQHVQAGDLAGILGRLTLRVVVVSRHGDDGLGNRFAQARLGVGLEFAKDHGGNFRRAELLGLAFHIDLHSGVAVGRLHHLVRDALNLFADLVELAPHESLHGENRVLRVGDRLTLGGIAHKSLAILGERHYRGSRAAALRILQYKRLAAVHHSHAGVRCS